MNQDSYKMSGVKTLRAGGFLMLLLGMVASLYLLSTIGISKEFIAILVAIAPAIFGFFCFGVALSITRMVELRLEEREKSRLQPDEERTSTLNAE